VINEIKNDEFILEYKIDENFKCNYFEMENDKRKLKDFNNIIERLVYLQISLSKEFNERFKINNNFNIEFSKDYYFPGKNIIYEGVEIQFSNKIDLKNKNVLNYSHSLFTIDEHINNNELNFKIKFTKKQGV